MEPSSALRRPAFGWHHRPERVRRAVIDDEPAQAILIAVRPPYPSPAPAEVDCAPQRARPVAGRLAQACPHRPASLPAASSRRIPLQPPTLSRLHTLAPAGSPGRDRRAQACGRRRGKGAPDPVRRHRPRARRLRHQVASWTPTSPPSRVGSCAPQRLESAPQPPSDGARARALRRPHTRRPAADSGELARGRGGRAAPG